MAEPQAVVRGRHLKALIAGLSARAAGERALSRLPASLLREVAEASGLDWLPVGHNVVIARAVYDGMGGAAADRFFHDLILESFEGPLLQTLVSTAVRIFGLDMANLVRWVPRGWHMLYRGVGTWTVGELGPSRDSVRLEVIGLPEVCAEDPVWNRAVGSSLSAMLSLVRLPGAVELQPRARGAREAVYQLRWGARAEDGRASPRV